MRCLAVSDIHCDLDAARRVVDEAVGADVVLAAGDFANQHRGLEDVIDVLRAIETPTVLVPGNNERPEDLRRACSEGRTPLNSHTLWTERGGKVSHGVSSWETSTTTFPRLRRDATRACASRI